MYDDDFISKDDAFLHSKWLSFMEKRLKKAKSLLRDDGCILISINENEVFSLKLLCDDIFGADNYLTNFAVKVRHENRILKGDKDFHEVFEYLLFYRKSHKHKTSKQTHIISPFINDRDFRSHHIITEKKKVNRPACARRCQVVVGLF
jgi:adenine-specific DNA-methyltransferase